MTGLATALGLLAGLVTGAWHAASIARGVRAEARHGAAARRLLVVAGVLVVAARAGHLAGVAAGWLIGFAAGAAVAHRRLR